MRACIVYTNFIYLNSHRTHTWVFKFNTNKNNNNNKNAKTTSPERAHQISLSPFAHRFLRACVCVSRSWIYLFYDIGRVDAFSNRLFLCCCWCCLRLLAAYNLLFFSLFPVRIFFCINIHCSESFTSVARPITAIQWSSNLNEPMKWELDINLVSASRNAHYFDCICALSICLVIWDEITK